MFQYQEFSMTTIRCLFQGNLNSGDNDKEKGHNLTKKHLSTNWGGGRGIITKLLVLH